MVGGLTPGGDEFAAPQPGAFWAQITGNAAGTNRYAWAEVDDGDTPTFAAALADGFGSSGGSGTSASPAYEVNGRTDVATGTRVLLRPAGDFSYYVFAAPDTGDGVTGSGTDNRIVRWDGTSAIQDSGATLTDGNRLAINQRANDTAMAGPGYEVVTGGSAVIGTGLNGNGFVLRAAEGAAGSGGCEAVYLETYTESRLGTLSFGVQYSYADAALCWAGSGPDGVFDSLYGFGVGGTAGLSGALAPGATATGGIITDLGTGSFVGTATANTFTNTNSFTSPGAGDVPLTVKAAAAQTADLIQALDSGGLTVLARVEADGEIEAASGAARLNSVLNDGQLALYNSAGASYATLTAGASNLLTASGGLTTGGALTVSSGGANITGTVTATTFSGSGASLTTLNASNLSSGTVAAARLPIGTDVQAYDADLSALAALSGTNTIYYRSGANTWSAVTVGSGLSFSSGTLSSSVSSGTVPNLLHNGGFEVWQRGTNGAVADDTYYADRWYALSQSGTEDVQRATGTLGAQYAALFKTNGASQRVGLAQIVEASDSIPYRGRTVSFQFKAKASASTAIRFAILEWVGTADSVTSDVVNDWTSSTYTASNFFGSYTVLAVGSGTATTSFASFSVSGTVSSSCNNFIVFVWTESSTTESITITECGLYDGSTTRDWLPRAIQDEWALCQRHLLALSGHVLGDATFASTTGNRGQTCYPVTMRAAPTLLSGATFTVNAGSAGTVALNNTGTTSTGFNNSANNWTVTAIVSVTATLSAEL